ncbi:MAG: radical SAM protein [Deltaproteobacteria bacterium RIFOXYD12_FULL_50_9]|nr:MAG: radical SAM protein [Deltaproteobacteria bacterium RIFOXYD12_FULL_50_9]
MQHTEHPDGLPSLVFANRRGEIKDFPGLLLAGRSGHWFLKPEPADLIPLPTGSELFVLPDRHPIGIDPQSGEPMLLTESPDDPAEGIQAVAAFMAPAHTSIHTAAYETLPDAPILPLFAYTAVGWYKDRFWVTGFRSDMDQRQESTGFDLQKIRVLTQKRLKSFPSNRLIQHLGKCCLTYSCPAAKNYFAGRFEAPLPTSPVCNANCVGCISLQPSGCCPSTQDRIAFVPTANELAEIAVPHLKTVKNSVVSFGQGCEGEPLLQVNTLEQAIKLFRNSTDAGTINLNTNASLPAAVERLADAGLDSIRVSMNSARPDIHERYYRPNGFNFGDVLASIAVMKKKNRFVSINYFILPGVTDDPGEFNSLCQVIENNQPDFLQLRNLNMDPEWYLETIHHHPKRPPMGIRRWLTELKIRFPNLRFGYYNPPLR